MNIYRSKGTISTKGPYGIDCALCTIEYIEREDDTFCYTFTPNYCVMDLLGYEYFDGIPGLNLDLRKTQYKRENVIPSFILERVPQKNREDYWEMLEAVGLEVMDPIEYLKRTDLQYFGDHYFVAPYTSKQTVSFSSLGMKKNLQGAIKEALSHLYHGDDLYFGDTLINDQNRKMAADMLLSMLDKHYANMKRSQIDGIEKAKKRGAYKGRKPIEVDIASYFEVLDEVKKGDLRPREAAKKLGISIDKYYRLKKKLGE